MDTKFKRPKIVLIIVSLYILAAIAGLYSHFTIEPSQLTDKFKIPSGILYDILSIMMAIVYITFALLLFFRKEIAKWVMLGIFIIQTLNTIYELKFLYIPDEFQITYIALKLSGFVINILLVWYIFKLKDKGYYLV